MPVIIQRLGDGLFLCNQGIGVNAGMMARRLGAKSAILAAVAAAPIDDGTEMKMVAHEKSAHLVGQGAQSPRIRGVGKVQGSLPANGFTIDKVIVKMSKQILHTFSVHSGERAGSAVPGRSCQQWSA